MSASRHLMICFSTRPERIEAARLAWHALVRDALFVSAATLPEAAALGQSAAHAVIVIDSDTAEPWVSLLRHLRRNAPDTPVLVFGSGPSPASQRIDDWGQLRERLAEVL